MAGVKVTRTKTGKKIWASWDCPYCDTKGIHGSLRECPQCGRPRSYETKYSNPGTTEYLTDDEVSTHQNPDWMCECCDSYNPDILQVCKSCGAPRGASKDYFEIRRQQEEKQDASNQGNIDWGASEVNDYEDNTPVSSFYSSSLKSSNSKFSNWKGIFGGLFSILAILFFVGLMVKVFSPKPVSFTIDSKSWNYSIGIEELQTIKDDGWSMPSDARLLDKEWKVKEYNKKIFDHYDTVETEVEYSTEVWDHDEVSKEYEDDGNGALDEIEVTNSIYRTEYWTETEETQEAVYRYEDVFDWYYYYEYDRWRQVRSIDTKGVNDEPYWGEYTLGSKEREGDRTKKYTISVTTVDNENKNYTVDEDAWFKLKSGDKLDVKVDITGSITEINTVNGDEWSH